MKKTVIKCTSRADWGRIIQWAEEIKPDCTRGCIGDIGYYYGFNNDVDFYALKTPPLDHTVLELSDFIAYPVKKEMLVSDDKNEWFEDVVLGRHNFTGSYLNDSFSWLRYAKPISPNQEKIDEIDRQIAELTKQKEELCNQ